MDPWRRKIQQLNERQSRQTADRRYVLTTAILLVAIGIGAAQFLATPDLTEIP